MSCRHDLALGNCAECYPSTGTIKPDWHGDNLDGSCAVPKETGLSSAKSESSNEPKDPLKNPFQEERVEARKKIIAMLQAYMNLLTEPAGFGGKLLEPTEWRRASVVEFKRALQLIEGMDAGSGKFFGSRRDRIAGLAREGAEFLHPELSYEEHEDIIEMLMDELCDEIRGDGLIAERQAPSPDDLFIRADKSPTKFRVFARRIDDQPEAEVAVIDVASKPPVIRFHHVAQRADTINFMTSWADNQQRETLIIEDMESKLQLGLFKLKTNH